jgi:hypothetical protein
MTPSIPATSRGPLQIAARRGARAVALLAVVAVVAIGCGSAPPSAGAPATDTPVPAASFTGGPATAGVDGPQAVNWSGGYCTRGTADLWLAVNIGDPNSAEYFGLVAGADPHGAPDAHAAAGGGAFRDPAATVTWRHGGTPSMITRESVTVNLAPDLSGGTFTGQLGDGTSVSGTFSCS